MMGHNPELANRAAYDEWALTYPPIAHNPLMRAEQRAMEELWPNLTAAGNWRALDLACGTGRYSRLLAANGVSDVIAVDCSAAMLHLACNGARVRADMMSLPFVGSAFDFVVSGLAVGHAPRIEAWMCEVARVLRREGILLYSDFHAHAIAAGMKRSFTDANKRRYTLTQHCHELAAHRAAAAAAGLTIESIREVRVGEQLCETFPGSEAFYRRWQGVPVVLVVRARKS